MYIMIMKSILHIGVFDFAMGLHVITPRELLTAGRALVRLLQIEYTMFQVRLFNLTYCLHLRVIDRFELQFN